MSSFSIAGSALPKWNVWLCIFGATATLIPSLFAPDPFTLRMWGVFFFCQAAAGLTWQPWGFRLEVSDEGISTPSGDQHPFEKLQAIVTPQTYIRSKKARFPMNLVFSNGIVRLPSKLNISSYELLERFRERRPQGGSSRVAYPLADFHQQQLETFGAERVWNSSGREQLAWYPSDGGVKAFGIGLIATGIVYLVVAMTVDASGPGAGGVFMAFLGLLFLVPYSGGLRQRKWGRLAYQNGIVIAPVGLAVSQGDLVGQISWDEIRSVRYPRRRGAIQLTGNDNIAGTIIEIGVAGAEIALVDVYDRPLDEIYERILRNWRPPN